MLSLLTSLTKNSVLSTIGNTPLVKLRHVSSDLPSNIEIYAKMEYLNPGGSIKDRAAMQMVMDGIKSQKLTKDKVILDSTSGNTGIALAMIGSVLGLRVELCVPANISQERKTRLNAYSANLIYTSPLEGSDGAIIEANKVFENNPDKYFKPDQYSNPSNPKAHFLHTGPEIWEQTEKQVTHFVATLGTTGTIMGTGAFLKSKRTDIQVWGAEPDDAFHGLEGLKHMDSSIVPAIYDKSQLDGIISVPTLDAYKMSRELCHDGHFVGQSSGAAVWASLELARRLIEQNVKQAKIVTILCDGGDRYYSTRLWDTEEKASN